MGVLAAQLLTPLAIVALTAVLYATRRRERVPEGDEGYLLYGVGRLLAGEQPIRDFRAYEPGRYWLGAAAARWRGGRASVVGTRAAMHVAVAVTDALLVLALVRAGVPAWQALVAGATVLGWNLVQHKLLDLAALLLVAAAAVTTSAAIADGPAALAAAGLGAAVGLAAAVGLNLALYGAMVAVVCVATGLAHGGAPAAVLGLALGGAAGTLPLAAWWLRHPGTFAAQWHARVTVPRTRGSTNLPLPVPWPWRRDVPLRAPVGGLDAVVRPLLGALPAVVAVAAALAAWRGGLPAVLGLGTVGLAALHAGLSRADLQHLGHPLGLLLATTAVLPGAAGVLGAVVAIVATAVVQWRGHPRLVRRRDPTHHERLELGGDLVWLSRRGAQVALAALRVLHEDEALAALPSGAYVLAAAGRRSIVTDTFCVYPATPEEDLAMASEIAACGRGLVLVDALLLDGREDRSFPRTHPTTWSWLQQHATLVLDGATAPGVPGTVTLWRVGDR